jgi:hypothetical protein
LKFRYNWLSYCHHSTGCKGSHELAFQFSDRSTGEIKELEADIKGIGKRLDTQEFINRSVIVGFVLAVGAGAIKFFFPNFPS